MEFSEIRPEFQQTPPEHSDSIQLALEEAQGQKHKFSSQRKQ